MSRLADPEPPGPSADERRMIRNVRTPPGWVPAFGFIFPPPGSFPRGTLWRSAVGAGLGIAAGAALVALLSLSGSWPTIAMTACGAIGMLWGFAHLIREDLRARAERPQDFPVFERPAPALSHRGMRLIAVALVACLIAAAIAAGALAFDGHPRLAAGVGIGILVLAIPGFAVAAWWSVRSEGSRNR
jgi:hypothetical protein